MNDRFLTTETNLKDLYIFHCLFTTSSFVMKAHFEKEPHFENESSF